MLLKYIKSFFVFLALLEANFKMVGVAHPTWLKQTSIMFALRP